jgi:hypothetical protein
MCTPSALTSVAVTLAAQPDVQALLLELARGDLRHFGVGGGKEIRQAFEDGHFGAQALPHAAQLQPDHAGADHAQALRHGLEIQRADVVDDVLAELRERQFDRVRTGRDDRRWCPSVRLRCHRAASP